jgi:hypothetical protein
MVEGENKTDKADVITKAELNRRIDEMENGDVVRFSADEWEDNKTISSF